MILDENGKPNTYWVEWTQGQHQTDYNNCRFAEDKLEFAKNWLLSKKPNIDWTNPKNVVDVIAKQKLRFITDDAYCEKARKFVDKVNVRWELPKEIRDNCLLESKIWTPGGKGTLIDWINHWKGCHDSKTFDWDPVWLKTNHGSGWNLRVDWFNMPTLPKYIAHKLTEWMDLDYSYVSGYERQYEGIKPRIIMEPELVNQPIDYGFWCVNGEIEGISLIKKLGKNLEQYLGFVDKDCKLNKWYIGSRPMMDDLPPSWKTRIDSVIPMVKELAKGWDFVRIDWNYGPSVIGYPSTSQWYFREMTFTPCSGILDLGEI